MGDWYIPRLNYKHVPSLLVGWDFPLNPHQSSGVAGTPVLRPLKQRIPDCQIYLGSNNNRKCRRKHYRSSR